MSLIVSAEELRGRIPAGEHECSRQRWMRYRDCEGCRELDRDYQRRRYLAEKPERQRRDRQRLEKRRAMRAAELDLRCPCPSCQAGW